MVVPPPGPHFTHVAEGEAVEGTACDVHDEHAVKAGDLEEEQVKLNCA